MRLGIRLLTIVAFALLLSSPRIISKGSADGGANHQGRNMHFGVSGGNVNDITKRFCCSGTLGALVTDGTTNYVLSNNHVLGLSGKANAGDDVSQPGLIDNGCRVSTVVADFTAAPQLGSSNVDAAVAQLRPGTMDETGFIEDIGTISSAPRAPSVGLGVAKSGRTTGFTTGTIGSINTSVSVQYQAGCGQGKKFVVSYTNQVVINSSTFSAGGDSGSLIVTNDANHNPVALLFAGSSTTTIGNPIGQVLTQVSNALGRTVSFVGSGQALSIETLASNSLLRQEMELANAVKNRHERFLMGQPGVMGVGVGVPEGDSVEGAIVVYMDRNMGGRAPVLPQSLDNVRVRVVLSDTFVAR
jgi:Peptidase family S64